MKTGHWPSGFGCRVSAVSSEKARAILKPDTRHLKPMLREGFTTPDNVQKKDLFFNHVTRSVKTVYVRFMSNMGLSECPLFSFSA